MNERKLRKLLVSGETETLEFKQSPNKSFYETTSAFSNARGGIIL
ncbi:MAG: transcriptional regulator, partial [Candidatus Cloacimonadota bacterium]